MPSIYFYSHKVPWASVERAVAVPGVTADPGVYMDPVRIIAAACRKDRPDMNLFLSSSQLEAKLKYTISQ